MTTEQPEVHKNVIKKPYQKRDGFPIIIEAEQRSSWFKAPGCSGKGLLNPPQHRSFFKVRHSQIVETD